MYTRDGRVGRTGDRPSGKPRVCARIRSTLAPPTSFTPLLVVALFLICLVALVGAGCASEADLLATLKSTADPAAREKAASDLALLHSVESTKSLVAAARSDETAQAGLESLRDAYILLIGRTIEKAEAERKELSEKSSVALDDALYCLAAIGDPTSIQALGGLVSDLQGERIAGDAPDFAVPDVLELQLQSVEALAGLAEAPEALTELVAAAALPGDAETTTSIREAAAQALQSHPEAVESLFQARLEAGDDPVLCATLDAALAAMGEAAVESLVTHLADQTWTDEILAEIGAVAVPRVSDELDSEDAKVRWRALGVLLRLYTANDSSASARLVEPAVIPLLIEARTQATYGDERDEAAEAVLAAIGEPSVKPLMGFVGKDLWAERVLAQIGAAAVAPLTAALGSDDRGVRFAAADILVQIEAASPESVSTLTADLDEADLKPIAANYAYYIRLGREGSEEVLSRALQKHGDKEMAVDYLNCGNGALEQAANEWADNHGYEVYTTPGATGGPQWGEGN